MAEVKSAEKIRSRYRIRLDNGDDYWLTGNLYQERPLQAGQEVDAEELAGWVTLRQYRSALDKAVAMLAARACSRGEIGRKLKMSGYAPGTVEMVLYKLEKNGLLNDAEFAGQWARYRTGQKYGPRRIAAELRQKGLSAEETEIALSALNEEDQLEQAIQLARKGLSRKKPGEDPRKALQRVAAGIVRRGYNWEVARQACEKAAGETGEDVF